jgi:septal ring factor EnvC (AmiA/AmiB activator)
MTITLSNAIFTAILSAAITLLTYLLSNRLAHRKQNTDDFEAITTAGHNLIADLERERQELKRTRGDKEVEIKTLKEENKQLDKRVAELERENIDLYRQIAECKTEIQKLKVKP